PANSTSRDAGPIPPPDSRGYEVQGPTRSAVSGTGSSALGVGGWGGEGGAGAGGGEEATGRGSGAGAPGFTARIAVVIASSSAASASSSPPPERANTSPARRSSAAMAAGHDGRARGAVVERPDRHHVGLALHEPDELSGELAEVRTFGVGAAALGDFAGGPGDRRGPGLKQLAHVGRRVDAGARQLGDGALDPLEQVGERGQVVHGGETAQ